jgi:hypothetical protein
MFSFFKKKKEEVVAVDNNIELIHANPQDFGWDLAEKNNLNKVEKDPYIKEFEDATNSHMEFMRNGEKTAPIQKDNSYETKMEMIKSHLYEKGNITSLEAIKLYNATRLSDVIFKLKQKGLDITTTPETYGKSRFVRYHLNKAIKNEQ